MLRLVKKCTNLRKNIVLYTYQQLVEMGTTDPIASSNAVITACLLEDVTRKQESVRVVVKQGGRNLRVTQVRM